MSKRRQITRRGFLGAGLCAGAWAAGCRRRVRIPGAPRAVFLFTIDTLRADHLAPYGYPHDIAPFLAELARKSVLFDRCYAATSITLPSHATLFTGLHLPQHGVTSNRNRSLDVDVPSLAQVYREQGYHTAGFVSVPFLDVLEGGHDTFENHLRRPDAPYLNAAQIVDKGLRWLQGRSETDHVFLWLHLFDPHIPYLPPETLLEETRTRVEAKRDFWLDYWTGIQKKRPEAAPWNGDLDAFVNTQVLYDAEVAFVDRELRRFAKSEAVRRYGNSALWVVTADHGEAFGEHGFTGHEKHIYQEELHVPLVLHWPMRESARRIAWPVSHIDLYPTLLEPLGIRHEPGPAHARCLLPVFERDSQVREGRLIFAQRRSRYEGDESRAWGPDPVYAVLAGEWKHITRGNGDNDLFDLAKDARELDDLVGEQTGVAAELSEQGADLFERLGGQKPLTPGDVTDEHDESLEAVGYV